MVQKELLLKNGLDRASPEHHENVKSTLERYTAHLLTASVPIIVSIIIYLAMHGWINSPAMDSDLQIFKREMASQLDGIHKDHAEFKALLTDLQRAQTDTVVRLTTIATILAERSANPPAPLVQYTPAGVLPPVAKKPKPAKTDPLDPGTWVAKQLGH